LVPRATLETQPIKFVFLTVLCSVVYRYMSKRAEKLSLEKEALSDRRQYLVKLAAAKWLKQGTDSIAARERMQEEERRR
jgi:hypothetical protein